MLLTIAATGPQADGLGFLLHKHPDRVRSISLPFGAAHVFYPVVSAESVKAAVQVEVDPIYLSRRKGAPAGTLAPYVNDRPYTASSLLSVAINKAFGTALAGTCDARPELVDATFDLEIEVPVIAAEAADVTRMFAPLGWSVETTPIEPAIDGYVAVRLTGKQTVKTALAHLYVLLPALDGQKHYWIDEAETDKLIRRGGDWLAAHPDRDWIARRYLRFQSLTADTVERLTNAAEPGHSTTGHDATGAVAAGAGGANSDSRETHTGDRAEHLVERPIRLHEARTEAVLAAVLGTGQARVIDLGCGEGRLLERLAAEPDLHKITGVDVSMSALRRAERRLKLDDLSPRLRERIELIQGALTYRDDRLAGFGVATVIEVIEHLDAERLDAFEQSIFGLARPSTVVITTPNVEYNVHFAGLGPGEMRHRDHRFEWTRAEFLEWCNGVAERSGYSFDWSGIGPDDPTTGPPTQMAVFSR